MTISRMNFSKKDFSVIVCPAVLRIVTIFCVAYFQLICYFDWMKYSSVNYFLFFLSQCERYKSGDEVFAGIYARKLKINIYHFTKLFLLDTVWDEVKWVRLNPSFLAIKSYRCCMILWDRQKMIFLQWPYLNSVFPSTIG